MGRRQPLNRRERLMKSREEWAKYGPAILELMERLEALERRRKRRRP